MASVCFMVVMVVFVVSLILGISIVYGSWYINWGYTMFFEEDFVGWQDSIIWSRAYYVFQGIPHIYPTTMYIFHNLVRCKYVLLHIMNIYIDLNKDYTDKGLFHDRFVKKKLMIYIFLFKCCVGFVLNIVIPHLAQSN